MSTLSNQLVTESPLPIVVGHSRIFIEIKDEVQIQFLVYYVQENKHIAEEKIHSILERLEILANNSKIPNEKVRSINITNFSVNYQVRLVDIFTLNQLSTELKELQKIDQSYREVIGIDRIEFPDR